MLSKFSRRANCAANISIKSFSNLSKYTFEQEKIFDLVQMHVVVFCWFIFNQIDSLEVVEGMKFDRGYISLFFITNCTIWKSILVLFVEKNRTNT